MKIYFEKNKKNGEYHLYCYDDFVDTGMRYWFPESERDKVEKFIEGLKERFCEDRIHCDYDTIRLVIRFPYAEEEAQFLLLTSGGIEI